MTIVDLESAYDMANSGFGELIGETFIDIETGLFHVGDEGLTGEVPPEDLYENPKYVEMPSKQELDLGTHLVWAFVEKEIPDDYDKVRDIFSRRGAYSRYKHFLEYRNLLEKWYDYENQRTREALMNWAQVNGIDVEPNE